MKSRFDKTYEMIMESIASARSLRDQEEWEYEKEPENARNPYQDYYDRQKKSEREANRIEAKKFKEAVKEEIAKYPEKSTDELKRIAVDLKISENDSERRMALELKPSAAMKELLNRDDVDDSFFEDFVFDMSDNEPLRAALKRIIVDEDPQKRIFTKTENGEYSIEQLKAVFDYMVDHEGYRMFDANYGRASFDWVNSLFSAMRRASYTGKKQYFKGKWPNETWADEQSNDIEESVE